MPEYVIIFFIIVVTAAIGSFIGMLCHRLPLMLIKKWRQESQEYLDNDKNDPIPNFNLALPRSHCPHCKTPIKNIHNIPLIAYLWLRGKCSYCQVKIPIDYFIAEFLVIIIAVVTYLEHGLTEAAGFITLFNISLVALSIIDARHGLLPDIITLPLLWVALMLSAFNIHPLFESNPIENIQAPMALIGASLGYLVFAIPSFFYKLIKKKDCIGGGDVKMLAAIGAWLGPASVIPIVFLSSILGLAYALIRRSTNREVYFGPFIAISTFFYQILENIPLGVSLPLLIQ